MTEGNLNSGNSLVEAVFNQMPLGVAVFDSDCRLREWNPTWARFVVEHTATGLEQIVVGAHLDQISAATAPYLEAQFKRVLAGETVRELGLRLRTGDQTTWWDIDLRPLVEGGKITGIIDIATDATERVLERQRADEREAQFHQVFDATSDAIVINDPESGIVVAANAAACRMHGYEQAEFIGLHPSQFIHKDSLGLFAEYIGHVNRGGEFRTRAVDIRKDGAEFDVEVSGTIFKYAGKPHLLAVIRDVGEQVRGERDLEQRVKERTGELSMLLDISHSIASTHDLDALMDLVLDRLRPVVDYSAAAVFVLDGDDLLRLLKYRGPLAQERIERNWPLATSRHSRAVIRSRAPVIIPDIAADEPLARFFREVAVDQLGGVPSYIASWMGVPLLVNDRAIGMIAFDHSEAGYFGEKQAALALAFANQAAAAIENARLFAQQASGAREMETLLGLARGMSSTLDHERVLPLILEQLHQLVDYTGCSILTLDGDHLVMAASLTGLATPQTEAVGLRFPTATAGLIWESIRDGRVVLVDDVRGDSEGALAYQAATGAYLYSVFKTVRSWIAVPLSVNERVLGMLTVSRDQPGFLTQHDAEIASAFASQAAIAMENARLFGEASARTRELSTLLDVSRNVNSTLELGPLLTLILEQLSATVEYAAANIFDLDGDMLRTLAIRRFDASGTGDLRRYPLDEVPANRAVIERREAVIIDDIHGDSTLATMFRSVWDAGLAEKFAPVHSWMGVPLVARDRVIGMLSVEHTEVAHWQQGHAHLVMAFAAHAAAAIENARLFERAEKRANEMEALSRVAATLTVDQPTTETLDSIASRVVEGTAAVACTVTLMGGERDFKLAGSYGLDPDFYHLVVSAVLEGAPSPTVDAFRSGRRQIVPNARSRLLAEPRYGAVHDVVRAATWETIVTTPLQSGGRKLGTLGTYYAAGCQPDSEDLALLAAIADQAAISVENHRLFYETERRLREAQALVRVASSLTFAQPLGVTLDTLAENVVSGTQAIASSLAMFDDDGQPRIAGGFRLPAGFADSMVESWRNGLTAEMARAVGEQKTLVLHNARARVFNDPLYEPIYSFMAEVEWDTVVVLPVIYRGRSVGALHAYYLKDHDPDDTEKELLGAVADQAAVAFENARLFAESERRIRDVEALYKADERLHQSLQLDDVLQSLVDVAVDVLQADKSLVVNFDPKLDRLFVRISRGYADSTIEAANQVLAQMPADVLAARTEPMTVEDALTDPRSIRAVTEPEGIRAHIDVPIIIGAQVFGLFDVAYLQPRTFSESEKRLLTALTQRAAVAIENARLYGRSQRAASLEERQRLARELHDSVSQALYGIALGARTARTLLDRDPAKVAEPLDYVLTLAEAGLAELRSLIFELRPESLETEGVIAALNKQFAALTARHGIEVDAELGEEPDVPIEVKEVVYRVAQEALNNTVKHARATRVEVRLGQQPSMLSLRVADNGRGFDVDGDFPGHLGLQSMSERAHNIGASLSIESSAEHGTTIRVDIPLALGRVR